MTNTPALNPAPQTETPVNFIQAVVLGFKYTFRWSGRASRRAFWLFYGILILPADILYQLTLTGQDAWFNPVSYDIGETLGLILWVYVVITFIPGISVVVRRLHDSNHGGWWWWIQVIPFIGLIVLLIFMFLPSEDDVNRYGPPSNGGVSNAWNEALNYNQITPLDGQTEAGFYPDPVESSARLRWWSGSYWGQSTKKLV